MARAKSQEVGFVSLRKGKNALESLLEYTSDSVYMFLWKWQGHVPVEWKIYSFVEGDFLADDEGEILIFDSLYDARGHLIRKRGEHAPNGD